MIEIFLAIGIGFLVGYYVGWHGCMKYVDKRGRMLFQQLSNTIQDKIICVDIVKRDEEYYVYNSSEGTFMAQGKTYKDVTDKLNKSFPGKLFATKEEDLVKLKELK